MSEVNHAGAPQGGRHPIHRAWAILVDGLSAIATLFIAVLMIVICADIVARNGLGSSLPLVSELGAMIVVLIVALQLPSAVGADRLARVELLLDILALKRPAVSACISAVFNLAGFAVLGMIAWSSFDIFQDSLSSRDFIGTPGIGTLPTWPFRALITIGMSVSALEFLFMAIAQFRLAFFSTKERA